ncbi:hypothetical protein [Aeromonas enteropelogenes]|uniref:hypothetical protein n=1 Tax=Aeromonas enteropelogenes TaxID=29489 RepID=UPI001CBDCD58|nr:hypothetical protein [Aeromonas enteropelogenes]UAK70938.1 hypothetical protein K8O95_14820 [Aeromonas enteropelogenes]
MKPIISIIGIPGVNTRELREALEKATDRFEFVHCSKMREALMVHAGLWHGNVDEILHAIVNDDSAPLFHLYVEQPQGMCLRNLRKKGFPRSEYFQAKPYFEEWARVGEVLGQVFSVNPVKEGLSTDELVHMITLFAEKVQKDTQEFLANKLKADEKEAEEAEEVKP